jgi:hypothetical protein
LEKLSNIPHGNHKIAVEFYLMMKLIKVPRNSVRKLAKGMQTTHSDLIEKNKILGNYYSSYKFCNSCEGVNRLHFLIDIRLNHDEFHSLEAALNEKYLNKTHTKCKQLYQYRFEQGIFIHPRINATSSDANITLQFLANEIRLNGHVYRLCFVISFVDLPPTNHFVTYCLKDSQWLMYDDLKTAAEYVMDCEIIDPRLMFYVRVNDSEVGDCVEDNERINIAAVDTRNIANRNHSCKRKLEKCILLTV